MRSIFVVLLTAVSSFTGCLDTGVPSSALPTGPKPKKGFVHVPENVVAPQPAALYNEKPVANVVETSVESVNFDGSDNVDGPDLQKDLEKSIVAIDGKLKEIFLSIEVLDERYFLFLKYISSFSLAPSVAIDESSKIIQIAIDLLRKLSQYQKELEKIERFIDTSNLPQETKDLLTTSTNDQLGRIRGLGKQIIRIVDSVKERTKPYVKAINR